MTEVTGLVFDAQVGKGSATAGSSTVMLDQITISASDVGKRISLSGVGAGGVTLQTTIASVINGSTITLASTPSVTKGDAKVLLGTDNAPAIQAVIDSNDGEVVIPKGQLACSALNFTRFSGVFRGKGTPWAGTWLLPFTDSGTWLDFIGRGGIMISDMTLGRRDNPNKPDVGILLGGGAAGGVDNLVIRNIAVTGAYRKAALGVTSGSGHIIGSAFWNFGDGYGAAFDLDNAIGFTSRVAIGGPYATAPWHMDRAEFHAGSDGNSKALLLRSIDDTTWTGCIISGQVYQSGIVVIQNASGGWDGMRRNVFIGNRFEAEGGPCQDIFDMQGNGQATFIQNMYGCIGSIKVGPGTLTGI